MSRLITIEDFTDVYVKLRQRGARFLLSKLSLDRKQRSVSAFDVSLENTSNWWEIPLVKERWNRLITGDAHTTFEQYAIDRYLRFMTTPLRVLSPGSGYCQHELAMATNPIFGEIVCLDINQGNLDDAAARAKERGLSNLTFHCGDIEHFDFAHEHFDLVMFNNSLHHFRNVCTLLGRLIPQCLKPTGRLLVYEYVGPTRFQLPAVQICAINEAISLIERPLRRRYRTSSYKTRYHGSGLLRMVIADPSEAVDSASILPALHAYYDTIEERPFGGNILPYTLKDIAFHFIHPDDRATETLLRLFRFEDDYLRTHPSDYIFGIYRPKEKLRGGFNKKSQNMI
jgi:conserved domain protein